VEYLYNIPWEYKNYQDREKGLLRRALEGVLPEGVLWRKKSPYPKTHHPEYLKSVSAILSGIISDPRSPLLALVEKKKLEALLTENQLTPWYGQLMTTPQTIAYFIQFNHWLKHYQVKIEI
ncbi:MAG: asparagine synthase C-terminal domain-containing protein, partial [Clostridiales bacterium]|nr:asparagine synthase C-terminal domain-containing protein [Clostridiales bacterium]